MGYIISVYPLEPTLYLDLLSKLWYNIYTSASNLVAMRINSNELQRHSVKYIVYNVK